MKRIEITWLILLMICVSCASNKTLEPQIKPLTIEKPSSSQAVSDFTLGPGDIISINVWRNPDLSRKIKINPSGKISLPLAGEINTGNMTVSDLTKEITERLSKYIKTPQVGVDIDNIASQKIYVMGEVNSPGTFSYTERIPLWEAISNAGGFTNDANDKNFILVRIKDEEAFISVVSLNFEELFESGVLKGDYYLKNGDVLYVPETKIANVDKFMTHLNNILAPIHTIQNMILVTPNVIDALEGVSGNVNVNP